MIYPIQTFFEFAQKWHPRRWSRPARRSPIFEQQPAVGPTADEPATLAAARRPRRRRAQRLRRPRRRPDDRGLRRCPRTPPPSPTGSAATCPPTPSRSARRSRRASRAAPPDGRGAQRLRPRARRPRRARRGARQPARGASPSAASTSARVSLDDVRRQILVSDTGSQLFAGTLQDAVDPHGRLTREQAEEAVCIANAEDVYDALPGGWQGELDERGRGLSGGQRQRVVLARALAADARRPRAGRADLGGRRPHRGPDRRPGRRAPRPDARRWS